MSKRVLIIGAGASGMTAAIFAARQGAQVTLLEHTERMGKKLLSTGNGKCNLSNRRMDEACYRSGEKDFPLAVLSRFGVEDAVRFFEDLGIVIKDRDGYLYPRSGQASSVLDVLRMELERRGVEVIYGCEVKEILDHNGPLLEYQAVTSKGRFLAGSVILAAGSKAAPSTGSDGSGYALAESLGLRVIKPLPALVQLKCREKFYKQVSGVRTEASVTLRADGRALACDRGELQLTDYGISGIPVFQVSRFAARALDEGKRTEAEIDFYPELSLQDTDRFLRERCLINAGKPAEEFFTGWFNRKLSFLFLKLAGIDKGLPVGKLSEGQKQFLVSLIKEFRTEIAAVNSFENAQVCCGGVDVSQIDPETMEVKNKKGLYLAGELLDVDGICGGYNLQWAWSTGAIAGTHAGI